MAGRFLHHVRREALEQVITGVNGNDRAPAAFLQGEGDGLPFPAVCAAHHVFLADRDAVRPADRFVHRFPVRQFVPDPQSLRVADPVLDLHDLQGDHAGLLIADFHGAVHHGLAVKDLRAGKARVGFLSCFPRDAGRRTALFAQFLHIGFRGAVDGGLLRIA